MIAQLSLYILNTISFLENKCFSTTLHTHTHTHTQWVTYQHCIMTWYTARGQPGGGGSRYPSSTNFSTYAKLPSYTALRFYTQYTDLDISVLFKWFVPQTPYLVHDTTKAPHITGCREGLVIECLRCCPLDWNHAPLCHIEIFNLSRHSKISYLQKIHTRVVANRHHNDITDYKSRVVKY